MDNSPVMLLSTPPNFCKSNSFNHQRQAVALCEKDEMCGGFTFRGSKLLDRQYNIYFFHLLINIESDRDSLKWMFYKSSKAFLRFPGTFSEKGSSKSWKFAGNEGEIACNGISNI